MAAAYARTGGIRRWDWLFLAVIGVAFLAFAVSGAFATGAPSISSDQSTYEKGGTVALSGSGWAAGETVHVTVDDASGDAWSHEADVTAADDGTLTDSLALPDVTGDYTVDATAPSGSGSAAFTVSAPAPPPPTTPTDPPADPPTTTTTPTDPPITTTTTTSSPTPIGPPTIASDQADYAPGATVTLTGENWHAGESVHIFVNDNVGQTWSRNVDVPADANGHIADQFDLPNYFIAAYAVTAAGPLSGTATTSFTDAVNLNVLGKDNNQHETFPSKEEDLGAIQRGTALALTCPRGTGLTARSTGNPSSVNWSMGYALSGANVGDGATLSPLTTLMPSTGTFTGNQDVCVAMTIATSTLTAGTTYHAQLRLARTAGDLANDGVYFFKFNVTAATNTAPTVGADNATRTVNEGVTATNTGIYSDPDGDAVTFTASVGSVSKTGTSNGTWSWSFATTDGPAQSQTVTITADDGHSHTPTATFTLTVNNVAPTATFNAPSSVNEGSSISISISSPSDPSSTDTSTGFTYAFDCGSGYGGFTSATATTCPTTDNGSRGVKGKIRDKDNGVTEYTAAVTVNNVDPTATFTAPPSANEAGGFMLSLTSPSDPSSADTSAGFTYAFDCGGGFGSFTASSTKSCTAGDDGSLAVGGKIRDKDGGFTTYTGTVSVQNLDPTISNVANSGPVAEGSSATITVTATDPAGVLDPLLYEFDCNNDSSYEVGPQFGNTHACAFADNGSNVVNVRVTDGDGGSDIGSTTVTVTNAPPDVTAPAGKTAIEGTSKAFALGSFSDAGVNDNPWAVDVDWGDGSAHTTFNAGTQGALGNQNHTYADGPNTYTVTVKVTDKDGGHGSATFQVTVANADPSLTAPSDQNANEGASTSFDLGSFSDLGTNDDPWAVDVDWGDGTSHTAFNASAQGSLGTKSHTYDNGPHTYTVTVTVTDSDGGPDSASFDVEVANVDPNADIANDGPVNEGSSATISLSNPSDPSAADTTAGFHYAFACDGGSLASATYAGSGTSASKSCDFDDNGVHTVRARIIDQDGGFSGYTTVVIVNNVPPTADLGNDGPVEEGSSATVSFSNQSDPSTADTNAGFHYAFDCDGGSLGGVTYGGSGTAASTSCPFADDGSYDVTGRIIDKDGGATEYTTTVTVTNAAPAVAAPATQNGTEGSSTSFDVGSFSDAGVNDAPWPVDVNWGDGSAHTTFDASTQGALDNQSHTYADGPNTYTVTVKVTDKDGGEGSNTFEVDAANADPSVTAPSDQNANEGSAATLNLGSFSDPGLNDKPWSVDIDWGDGSSLPAFDRNTQGSLGTKSHTYDDGPNTYTVTVTVTDKDGGSDSASFDVAVANVDPTASLSNGGPVDEGSSATVSFSNQSDPSTADTNAGFHYAFSCSNGDLSGATYAASGASDSRSCPFDDNGTHTVKARVIDKNGGFSEYTTGVAVNNVPPTADLDNDGPVDEGSSATVSFSNRSDPSTADTNAGFHYAFSCSNGNLSGATYAGSGTSASTSCPFADNGADTVKARIIDKDGGFTERTTFVTVNNVAPVVAAPATQSADEGSVTSFDVGSFTDAGVADSPWAVDVDWGDGSVDTTFMASAQGSFAMKSHKYDDGPATRTVTVKVKDKDGSESSNTFEVDVANVDPTGTLGNNGPVNEGSSATVSFTAQTDPSGADTSAGFHYAFSCSNGDLSPATYAGSSATASTSCTYADGPSDHTVKARIIDKNGGFTEYTTSVHVNDVKPVVTVGSVNGGVACVGGNTATLGFTWVDPAGASDSYGYDVDWGDGSAHTTGSNATSPVSGLAHTYGAGGPYTIIVKVNDEDPGAGDSKTTSAFSFVYSTGQGILQPINYTGARSLFKQGSTIPVKVKVTDCAGNPVSGLTLNVGLVKLDGTPDGTVVEDVVSTTPDTGTVMRFTGSPDSQYIFNLGTKNLAQGDYKVTISGASIAPISATFSLKK